MKFTKRYNLYKNNLCKSGCLTTGRKSYGILNRLITTGSSDESIFYIIVLESRVVLNKEELYSFINYSFQNQFCCFRLQSYFCAGEMAERSNAAVLKTVDPKGPGVRIPLSPLWQYESLTSG